MLIRVTSAAAIQLVAIVVAMCPAIPAQGDGFAVQGHLTTILSDTAGEDLHTQEWAFRVQVYGETWRVSATCADFPDLTYEMYSDGKVQIQTVLLETLEPGVQVSTCVATNGLPVGYTYPLNVPWLAYASASYLASNRMLPAPWLKVRHPGALVYEPSISVFPGQMSLPRSIVFRVSYEAADGLMDNPLISYGGVYKTAVTYPKYLRENYDDGEKVAEYSVGAVTNVSGITIPLEFSMSVKLKSTPEMRMWERQQFEGKVDSVVAKSDPVEAPGSHPLLNVSDYRFRRSDILLTAINYSTNSLRIADMTAPRLQEIMKRTVALYEEKVPSNIERTMARPVGRFARIALLAVVVIPAIVLSLRLAKR